MPTSGITLKREPIKTVLTADLVESLDFDRWPVSPVRFEGKKLVTEPTPSNVKEWVVRDATTAGFGVRVYAGAKSYFVQRKSGGSTSRRFTLTEQRTLGDARRQAIRWYADMVNPEFDPKKALKERAQVQTDLRAAKRFTFGRAFEEYIGDGYVRVDNLTLRPATLTDRKQVLRWMRKMDLWATPLLEVDVGLVDKTFAPLFAQAELASREVREPGVMKKRGAGAGSDVSAVHKCLAHCNAAWNESMAQKVAANPFSVWRKHQRKSRKLPKVKRRTTVLATDSQEGVAWLKGLLGLCESNDAALAMLADYVLLSVLWGGRKTEGSLIRWRDVDFVRGEVCFSAETTKANKHHFIPLTPWSVSLLQSRREKNQRAEWSVNPSDFVFPYPYTKSRRIEDYRPVTRLLQEQTGLWIRLHDLRRTLAGSVFGSVKNLGTVAIALGHSSGKEVTEGYVPHDEALAALREIYVAREKGLRRLVGLDAQAPADQELSVEQRVTLAHIRRMMKEAGLETIPSEMLSESLGR